MEFWVLILTVWVFYRWVQSRIRRKKEDERFARVIEALNKLEPRLKDLAKLETRVHELEHRLAASLPASQPPAPVSPAAKAVEPLAPVAISPAIEIAKPVVPPPVPVAAEPRAPKISVSSTPPPSEPSKPVVTPPAATAPHPPAPPPRAAAPVLPPPFLTPGRPASVSGRELSSQLEETLGKDWLNKLGIVALVIGISLFLAYKFPSLSNPEKIGLGYLLGFAILGLGIWLESSERYRVFARALIGGGWALTFFVTYAMYFVPYTRVIDTQWVDLVLLFVVAGVMVAHTLRYDSQVVTGLAFLLAFTTVAISQNTIYSLSAGAILALGLVAIVHRRDWFELEVFGILASYINHFIWLTTVILPTTGHRRVFPEFMPSTILLCMYWAAYRWSYIERRIQSAAQERVSTLAAILNTSLLLGLFKYQSVRPQLAFCALLSLGAIELTLGQLPATRRRRVAFILLSTIGIVLLVAAIPFKYSGMDTAVIWLAEAQMLVVAGVVTREVMFRRFGLLVALLTSGDMLTSQALPRLYDHISVPALTVFDRLRQTAPATDLQLAVSFLVAALLFYGNALVIPRRWKDLLTSESEAVLFRALSYLAAVMLLVSLWLASPDSWTAVLWAAAAFLLAVLSRALPAKDLRYQAHLFALATMSRAIAVNYFLAAAFLHTGLSLRLVTMSLVIALFYFCARWLRVKAEYAIDASEIYTTAAAIVVVLLAYRECDWAWIAPAWGAFALVLAVVGIYRNGRDLSLQAHVIVLAGFARTLIVNIDATQEWHHFTVRFLSFTLMAVLLYLCAYFSGPRDADYARLFSALHTWAGSILIGVLAFKEVASPWIAVAWAVFALLLLIIGDHVKRIQLHFQAYILSASALFQIATVNLLAVGPWSLYPRVSLRLATVALVAAIFYSCARWAAKGEFEQGRLAGAAYTWTASALVVLLLYYELTPHAVALGWALFGLALFEIGVQWNSRNWRLQSYALFGLSFVRLATFNLVFGPRELLLTTLPVAFVFYFVYARVARLTDGERAGAASDPFGLDRQIYAGNILAYLGSATLVLFVRSYFADGWVVVAWASLSLAFIGVSWGAKKDEFLRHSVIVAFLVFLQCLAYEAIASDLGRPSWKVDHGLYVAVTAVILFAAQAFAFPLRERFTAARSNRSARELELSDLLQRPEQIYFFLPMILVTWLILNEVTQGRVTIGWGIEAVAAFLFALIVGERSFRLAGLALLLVCVAKIVVLDVWRQERSDRFITFIILGVALLLVSYLYTRYSEAIRRYL